jgi:hypothetical protein
MSQKPKPKPKPSQNKEQLLQKRFSHTSSSVLKTSHPPYTHVLVAFLYILPLQTGRVP